MTGPLNDLKVRWSFSGSISARALIFSHTDWVTRFRLQIIFQANSITFQRSYGPFLGASICWGRSVLQTLSLVSCLILGSWWVNRWISIASVVPVSVFRSSLHHCFVTLLFNTDVYNGFCYPSLVRKKPYQPIDLFF